LCLARQILVEAEAYMAEKMYCPELIHLFEQQGKN
jgi:hypothetical protein